MAARGRATRLTDATQAKIVLALRDGHYLRDAARAAGISHSTLQLWLRDARALSEGKPRPSGNQRPSKAALMELISATDAATFDATDRALKTIRCALESGDVKAAIFWLTHRHPETWGGHGEPEAAEASEPQTFRVSFTESGAVQGERIA